MKQNKKAILMAIIAILSAILILTGCPNDTGDSDKLAGKILILQAYASASDAAGATHSFVELYNRTNKAVKLNGASLYYAAGHRNTDEGWDDNADKPWQRIALSGTIPAKGSFLILGLKQNTNPVGHKDAARYQIPDDYGDINDNNFTLYNRAFKVALIQGNGALTVQNPFDIDGNGKRVSGYIDMVGARNTDAEDSIYGFETAPARCSASVAVRRFDITDTNDNSEDFITARYASTGNGAFTNEMLEVRRPRNSGAGSWDPFAEPEAPLPTEGLMIFQVYGTGFGSELGSNDNTNTGSVSHSFIELYNNTDAPIDLSTYSVQWANGKANGGGTVIEEDEDWNVINLTGTIPAYGSYLIRGRKLNDENGTVGRLQITVSDQDDNNFYMSNRSFKVALVSNQVKLAEAQPWDNASEPPGPKAGTALVDLLGARNGNNDSTVGFKGAMNTNFSKQNALRRVSLSDSGNNSVDFTNIDYRTTDLAKFRPRSATNGSWTPEF
ncbi:MAG: hypothetical protein LBI28_10475 [Treponema sp.]|jgi:hypothetical protein|nr:hypothetical protein [Treponema sp.]